MLIGEDQAPRYIAERLRHESTWTVLDVHGHLYEGSTRPPWRVSIGSEPKL
jgi:hypothetical protein